jgi:polar amino acid transport system substrate-binding protein
MKVWEKLPIAGALLLATWCVSASAEDLAAMVPAKVRQAGEITAASNAAYPPFAFADSDNKAAGIEPDLLRAMAEKLGLKAALTPIEFVGIMPALQAGRFDVGLGGFFDTEARRQVVTFIDYMYAVDGLITRPGNPDHISVNDLCGKTISGSETSAEVLNLNALSKRCTDAGKPAIDVVVLKGTPAQIVAVKSGRVMAANVTKAVVVYVASQPGAGVEDVPGLVENADGQKQLDGIMLRKDEPELAKAMEAATNALIADGTYARIMKKWGIPEDLFLKRAIRN